MWRGYSQHFCCDPNYIVTNCTTPVCNRLGHTRNGVINLSPSILFKNPGENSLNCLLKKVNSLTKQRFIFTAHSALKSKLLGLDTPCYGTPSVHGHWVSRSVFLVVGSDLVGSVSMT